ncbi:hypothetical protein [Paenibacillus lautus]|uniref:hypothetical protein n=1 Tax=Paenibacillus lautus TaxID=1401 RepID=UPI003D2B39F2
MGFFIVLAMIIGLIFSTMGFIVNEKFALAIIVDVAILIIGFVILNTRSNKKLKAKAMGEDGLDYVKTEHIEGLPVAKNAVCTVVRYKEKIQINALGNTKFDIPIDRINALELKNEQEFIDLDRSVVGRAVIGTLLVPGLGTIIGGLSGMKSKKKKPGRSFYLIINYLDKDGQLKGITLQNDFDLSGIQRFVQSFQRDIFGVSNEGAITL